MKLLMLAKSSMKKNLSSSITLFCLIVIATVFLYIGFIIFFNLDGFIDQKNESLNGADFVVIVPSLYNEKVEPILNQMDSLRKMEKEDVVLYNTAEIQDKRVDEKPQSIGLIFLNSDIDRSISKLKIVGEKGTMKENSIILPYYLKSSYGYEIGDTIETTFMDKTFTFVIYGFSEDIMFSTASNLSYYKCFVPEQQYKQLYNNASEFSKGTYYKAVIDDGISPSDIEDSFVKLTSKDQTFDTGNVMALNYDSMKIGTKATVNIIMTILIFFATLVLIISMVVIRYTVITHVEEDIKNIGSMEAAGFTTAIIRGALILQFLFIATVGYLAGILISINCSGAVTNIISSSIGLDWKTNISPISLLITLAMILLLLFVIIIKVTQRIRKITPLMALRSGIDTFHFGRNYFPFETTHGNVNLILGFKQIFNNKKQSISVAIIGILMSFTMMFAFSMHYNFVIDNRAFLNIAGMEKSDIAVLCYNEKYAEAFQKAAEQEGIKKAFRYTQSTMTLIKDNAEASTTGFVCNDFESLEFNTIIDGRYPIHDNEIVLSTQIQKKLKAKIGDVVNIKAGTTQYDYLVVGISQHINQLGQSVSLTEEGMQRSNPSFAPNALLLYVDNNEDIQKIIDQLSENLTDYDATVTNMDDVFTTMMSSISRSIILICIIICIITALIIAIILYYLVKVKIIREKTTLGIQKALGFTTGQLILHNNITLLNVIFISTLIGSALAALLINPLCTLLLKSISGLRNCSFTIPVLMVLLTVGIMTTLTAIITTFVSMRIRKLNPRELIAD